MRLLIDTSAYSVFLHGHPQVVEEVARAQEIYLSPIVLGELLSGFRKGNRYAANLDALRSFLSSPRVDVVAIDDETANRYGLIKDELRRKGQPIPTNDTWIAASAMEHGLRLLTLDTHFQRIEQIAVTCATLDSTIP